MPFFPGRGPRPAEYYEKVTTTRKYEDRLATLEAVRQAGISVCAGGIIGLGEQELDRVGLLHQVGVGWGCGVGGWLAGGGVCVCWGGGGQARGRCVSWGRRWRWWRGACTFKADRVEGRVAWLRLLDHGPLRPLHQTGSAGP